MSTLNLVTSNTNTNIINPIDNIIYAYYDLTFLIGSSGIDVPNQIPFKNNFNTPSDPVYALTNGDLIFTQTGLYELRREHLLGRFNAANEAYVFGFTRINGVDPNSPDCFQIAADAEQWIPFSRTETISIVTVPTTYQFFMFIGGQSLPGGLDAYLLSLTANFPGGVSSPGWNIYVKRLWGH